MSSEHYTVTYDKTFWVAIQPSPETLPNVFGPYTKNEATANRETWKQLYPSSTKVSSVFRAQNREEAEANVGLYLPS